MSVAFEYQKETIKFRNLGWSWIVEFHSHSFSYTALLGSIVNPQNIRRILVATPKYPDVFIEPPKHLENWWLPWLHPAFLGRRSFGPSHVYNWGCLGCAWLSVTLLVHIFGWVSIRWWISESFWVEKSGGIPLKYGTFKIF